jgi:hypothetical protein
MSKLLCVLGAVALTVMITAGVGLGALFYNGHELDEESKAFVDSAIPAITGTWSEEQLLDRSTIELRESIKPDELRALFDRLSQFGPQRWPTISPGRRELRPRNSGEELSEYTVHRA